MLTRRNYVVYFERSLSADDCMSELMFVFREEAPSRDSVYQ